MRGVKILLFLIFFWPCLALAKTYPVTIPFYDINSLDIEININARGDVEVSQRFLLSSPSPDFSWSLEPPISKFEISSKEYSLKKQDGKLYLSASQSPASQNWLLKYKAPSALKSDEQDHLYLPLVIESGVYIRNLKVIVHLPAAPKPEELKQRVYAIHGVGSYSNHILDSRNLIYEGSDLSPFATYTIQASWPKGLIQYPFFKRVSFLVQSLGFIFWLSVGIVLFLLTFLFYLFMRYKQKQEQKITSSGYLDKPPEDLPPALVGILLRERASQREITATILDLAQRGFIDIVKKREEYVLGKRRGEGALSPYESFLYDKLFTQQGERKIKRTEFELEQRAAEQLYSPKISKFYQDLYQLIQEKDYFVKNPVLVSLKYRIVGIVSFILAILASFVVARYSPGPPYALFGFLGQIIASFLIIKAAPLMPKRTKRGKEALSRWLAFGKFLSDKKPLDPLPAQQDLFEKYLPYAVALGKEIDWLARFRNAPFTPPNWYVADEIITLENFTASLFYITASLSQILYLLREAGL
jgi:hypothetical protein